MNNILETLIKELVEMETKKEQSKTSGKHRYLDNAKILAALQKYQRLDSEFDLLKTEGIHIKERLRYETMLEHGFTVGAKRIDCENNCIVLADGRKLTFNAENKDLAAAQVIRKVRLDSLGDAAMKAQKSLWVVIKEELNLSEGNWSINQEYGVIELDDDDGMPSEIKDFVLNMIKKRAAK